LLCKKKYYYEIQRTETGCNLAESSKEGCGSKRALLPVVTTMMLNKNIRILGLLERDLGRRFREYGNERSRAITWAAEYLSADKGRSWSFHIATYAILLLKKAVRRTSQIFHFQKLAILKEVLFRFQFISFCLREAS
jgi:hypothetical protein